MRPVDRLIFALDVPTVEQADALVDRLAGHVGCFKIGLELFIAAGADLVRRVRRVAPVFLDLKLHDIPATVGRSAAASEALGVEYLTVHVDESGQALREAVRAAPSVKILGITVLTSITEADLRAGGFAVGLDALVRQRARMSRDMGCGGVVCSGQEAADLRSILDKRMEIITPGVRPAASALCDQRRVVTPSTAIRNGSDRIVVGRPIRDSIDPVVSADGIVAEIAATTNSCP
jgi:orotidine-5'-phosphate decarboxylase